MGRPFRSIVVLFSCSLPLFGSGQDDPIKKDLTRARASYDAVVEKLRKALSDTLDTREKAAREKGDKKAVDAVKSERESLKGKGEPPASLLNAGSRAELQKARSALDAAYKAAIRDYTKASKDAEAAAVEKEHEEFKRSASSPVVGAKGKRPPLGPVKEGVSYEGSFRAGKQLKSGGIGKTGQIVDTYTLHIRSIDGETFSGEWAWGKGQITRVEGTISRDGVVKFQFKKNLKGTSQAIDGQCVGTIDPKAIKGKFARASDDKIGVFEGKLKE